MFHPLKMVQVYPLGMFPVNYGRWCKEYSLGMSPVNYGRWCRCILQECHRRVTINRPWRDDPRVSFENVTGKLRQLIHEEIVQVYPSGMSPASYDNLSMKR